MPTKYWLVQFFKCIKCDFRNHCSILYMDESVGCEKYKLKLEN